MRTRPTTELTVPYEGKQGNRYILKFGLFPENAIQTNIPLVDTSLNVVHINQKPSLADLAGICKLVVDYLKDSEAILYFYYDNSDDISVRDRGLVPQKYRSLLFNRLIDRYAPTGFVRRNMQIKDIEDDHFITLITHEEYTEELDSIYSEIETVVGK